MGFINKIFGTHSQHELKRIKPIVDKILGMREQWVALSDEELQHKTVEFKERLAKGETLDDILPEAFATVREASRRVVGRGALSGSADGRYRTASGPYCRDAYW